jgi:hypothetical protein
MVDSSRVLIAGALTSGVARGRPELWMQDLQLSVEKLT